MTDLLTVVTCTVGDSGDRLDLIAYDLHRFTRLPFRHVVCDDGSRAEFAAKQRRSAEARGAKWVQNPGPKFGVSHNLNWALAHVMTPWVYLVEDGLRPPWGWLEVAVESIDKIGSKSWQGRPVGMMGFSHIQDWQLAMGGAIPTDRPLAEWYGQIHGPCYDQFFGMWNDGWWCWNRLLPGLVRACQGNRDGWPRDAVTFAELIETGMLDAKQYHPNDYQQFLQHYRTHDRWPSRRVASCGWYPGAFMLVNMDAWRAVGKFRDGCTFFEGHLGTRMGMNGYISLCVESPPWLHRPSMGFQAAPAESPRDHRDTEAVFREDFGLSYMDAPNVLANEVTPLDVQRKINEELAEAELTADDGWKKWM